MDPSTDTFQRPLSLFQDNHTAETLEALLNRWDALLKGSQLNLQVFASEYFNNIPDENLKRKLTDRYITTLTESANFTLDDPNLNLTTKRSRLAQLKELADDYLSNEDLGKIDDVDHRKKVSSVADKLFNFFNKNDPSSFVTELSISSAIENPPSDVSKKKQESQPPHSPAKLDACLQCWDALLKNNQLTLHLALEHFNKIPDENLKIELTNRYVAQLCNSALTIMDDINLDAPNKRSQLAQLKVLVDDYLSNKDLGKIDDVDHRTKISSVADKLSELITEYVTHLTTRLSSIINDMTLDLPTRESRLIEIKALADDYIYDDLNEKENKIPPGTIYTLANDLYRFFLNNIPYDELRVPIFQSLTRIGTIINHPSNEPEAIPPLKLHNDHISFVAPEGSSSTIKLTDSTITLKGQNKTYSLSLSENTSNIAILYGITRMDGLLPWNIHLLFGGNRLSGVASTEKNINFKSATVANYLLSGGKENEMTTKEEQEAMRRGVVFLSKAFGVGERDENPTLSLADIRTIEVAVEKTEQAIVDTSYRHLVTKQKKLMIISAFKANMQKILDFVKSASESGAIKSVG